MNWGGFASGFASTFDFKGLAKYAGDRDLRAARDSAKEAAVNDLIKQGQAESVAATTGVTGKPGGAGQDSPNYVSTEGQQAIPNPTSGATPSNPAGAETPTAAPAAPIAPTTGEGAKAIAQESAQPITPAPAKGLQFNVGGKPYATREEAIAAAEKAVQSDPDMMTKHLVPRMRQAYIDRNDIAAADAWGKWAEEKDNKAAMKEWASAYRAATSGNFEKASEHVFNLYKRYDDGITPMSKETVKDKDGNITGFNVRLKNDKSGEEYSQFIDKKSLTEMGLAALAPPQMFEMQFKRQQQADTAAAEAAKDERNFSQQKELKGIEHGNALEKMSIEKQLDAANATNKVKLEVKAKVDALKGAGYSEEFINGVLPGIIGVGEYKKATSPEEARRLAHSDRMKSDPMYSRKSADDQQAILDQDMKLIYGGVKPSSVPAAAGGLPAPAPKGKGVPFFDTKTGTVIYR